MYKGGKTSLPRFLETPTWCSIILIQTHVVEPHNELAVARSPTVAVDSEAQVPVNRELSQKFEREKFGWVKVGRGEFHNLVTRLCKLQSHNFFDFLLYFHSFYTYTTAIHEPCVIGCTNLVFIRENNLKLTLH